MTPTKRTRFDQLSRYRLSALLFGLVYVLLILRTLHIPDIPTDVMRAIYLVSTTPAIALLAYNVGESSLRMYQARRRIDQILDEQDTSHTP